MRDSEAIHVSVPAGHGLGGTRPSPDSEFLQARRDSHFVAKEWIVREDATHAKSKTYKRADLLPGWAYFHRTRIARAT